MIALMQFLKPRRRFDAGAPARPAQSTEAPVKPRDPPVVLAEVIAAASFIDFGGIPDARLFHTLYDWRDAPLPEDAASK
jgi:hypothetical protein